MESFWDDLHYEDIHFRDSLQFELQSDFAPLSALQENISTQEFYFFIPSALQINRETYSKEQFYKDRTNLIRYKTPEFTFRELIDKNNAQSPLNRIDILKNSSQIGQNILMVQDELKLLGNIVRSALRVSVRGLLNHLEHPMKAHGRERLQTATFAFCADITAFRDAFLNIQETFLSHWSGDAMHGFFYVDEFIGSSIDYYLTGYLEYLRRSKVENIHAMDRQVCEIVAREKRHLKKYYQVPQEILDGERVQERTLYHKGLLNKYVLDALLLGLERTSWVDKYGSIIAGLATSIAMLFYVLLVFYNVSNLGFNSLPFLLLTVMLYVLRDRIKDGLKTLFHQKACQWFSDYTTQIKSPNSETPIGKLKESFSFITNGLPDDVEHIRQSEFDRDLPLFKRPEEVFYYKKEMILQSKQTPIRARRHKLHNIFLFNIHLLLEKASNPQEPYLSLDLDTMEVKNFELPKVYHINIIMKNTYVQPDLQKKVELKKFRLVIDKNGIKRVEIVHK